MLHFAILKFAIYSQDCHGNVITEMLVLAQTTIYFKEVVSAIV